MMSSSLSEAQIASLFDILSHHDTYAEIRDFRHPKSLEHYGPPFSTERERPSTSPALQTLVSRFLLNLPGLKDLPEDFWKVQLQEIIEKLERANLSESYDKGVIGSRKTLATAISALVEYPVRGTFGGFAQVHDTNHDYDLSSADDLARSFRDFLDQCIYGNILEEMVERTAQTDQLDDHGPLTQAVHEFVLVNLASLLHYTLVLTPKGQYLVKLIDNINKLVPYTVVRQTLRIGNVASMINAMVRVALAKVSVASFTNWMGLTAVEDEGMNLMQSIISTVLSWDNKDLESRASKIEKEKCLSREQTQAIKNYLTKSMEDHDKLRKLSLESSISIIIAIFTDAQVSSDLSEADHQKALDYLSIQLSIRDRKEITNILCHSVPDHFTTSVRALVSAYEPNIRQLHNAVDLSDAVYNSEMFLRDMLKLAKVQPPGKDGKSVVPTVGDFVQLLKKHQYSSHKFMHQCCKSGQDLTGWYLDWAKQAAAQFKRHDQSLKMQTGAGDLTAPLSELFDKLPKEKQDRIIPILDSQTEYINEMHAASSMRLQAVIDSSPSKNPSIAKILTSSGSRTTSRPGSRAASPTRTGTNTSISTSTTDHRSSPLNPNNTKNTSTDVNEQVASTQKPEKSSAPPPAIDSDPGPGAFLARWQDLLESTPITPLTPTGDVKRATSKEVVQASATDVDGSKTAKFSDGKGGVEKVKSIAEGESSSAGSGKKLKKPNVSVVVECLGDEFRTLLSQRGPVLVDQAID